MSDQYLRKCSLIVSKDGTGLDLSPLRIAFKTVQSDCETPNHAFVRVFNASDQTGTAAKEFTSIRLQAGYETGAFGTIFDGTIKQVRRGRVDQVNTYIDFLASDGDIPYNFGVVRQSLPAGATIKDELNAIAGAMGLPVGYLPDMPPGASQRGQVKFGMGRSHIRDIADKAGMTWSIQNGKLQMIPVTSYKPGEVVVLNAATGMIGLPEQTQGGILVRCLLNPKLQIGGLLQIDNASIQKAFTGGSQLFQTSDQIAATNSKNLPKVTADGFYRIYVCEFDGDTRGQPWYTNITCLAVDRSAPVDSSVNRTG